MKNGTATGKIHINIETLKAGEDTISKTLAKLYIKCLLERRLSDNHSTSWKNAKMVKTSRWEQAGFRSRYSTTYHINVVNQLKEKCRQHPLCIAFVDYEKPFDSVQNQAVLTSLQEQGIEGVYIELLKEIYTICSMTVHLHKEGNTINIRRGVW